MKERKDNKAVGLLLTVLLALGINMSVIGIAVAQTEIPAGATIDLATLSVYADTVNSQTVNVHRVTADWQEMTVTWGNFGGSYASDIVNSFVADTVGWYSVDVTDLVQGWVDGIPNYGVLLEQGPTLLTRYASSEYATVALRPMLEIVYTPLGGSSSVVTIQRMGAEQLAVADAYIWEPDPNWQRGDATTLYTGLWTHGGEKQSLIRFDFICLPGGGGGHTPGFWQNKHGLGLIEEYDLLGMINDLCLADDYGHIVEDQINEDEFANLREFKMWLKKRTAENMAYQLSGHLVAMKLNVEVGFVDSGALVYLNEDWDMIRISDLMDDAAAALCDDGYTPAGDVNRDDQEMLKNALDDANNNLNWVNP